MKLQKYLHWTLITPVIAWAMFLLTKGTNSTALLILSGIFLMGSVLSAVHHAEVIAHKVGEPFGTIILAIAITIIEVALIISLMIAGGKSAVFLARDTVFAAIMLLLNGVLGACLLIGSARFHEQFFAKSSANTALISLVAILVLTLILPNFTTSVQGPIYSEPQLIFVAIACVVIYGTFLLVQTIRHRNYFVPETKLAVEEHQENPTTKLTVISLVALIACLGIVVLLAKALSPSIETMVSDAGLPKSLVGVIIAAVVLLPEGIAAVNAARRNDLQTSLNLTLGSALACIGLTIPSVAVVCSIFDLDLVLGLDLKSMILLALTVFITMLALSKGRTNILYGVVLLVNLAAYIFTIIYP